MKLYSVIAIGTNGNGYTKHKFGNVITDSEHEAMMTIDTSFQKEHGFDPQTIYSQVVPEAMIARVTEKSSQ